MSNAQVFNRSESGKHVLKRGKYSELLHSKIEIAMRGIAKIIDYIMSHVPMAWGHPIYPLQKLTCLHSSEGFFMFMWNIGILIALHVSMYQVSPRYPHCTRYVNL